MRSVGCVRMPTSASRSPRHHVTAIAILIRKRFAANSSTSSRTSSSGESVAAHDAIVVQRRADRVTETISAIVPTIGRVQSLTTLLEALIVQTRRPDEVVVADG